MVRGIEFIKNKNSLKSLLPNMFHITSFSIIVKSNKYFNATSEIM